MGAPFAAREPQHLPHAAAWAVEVASGLDAGVRVSLRLDLSAYELFDTADTYAVTASREGPDEGAPDAPRTRTTRRSATPPRPSCRCTASPTRRTWSTP